MTNINPYKRYQIGLSISDLFPSKEGVCACGCGKPLSSIKKKWASKECQLSALRITLVVKGDTQTIRQELFKRDNGICCSCGHESVKWHADHILPVHLGGGGCYLDNFNTLCVSCHDKKTKEERHTLSHQIANSSHDIFT